MAFHLVSILWRSTDVSCGILTIIVAIVALIFLVDVPNKAKFLTTEEKEMINTRIERDRADSADDVITGAKVREYLCDWKMWWVRPRLSLTKAVRNLLLLEQYRHM